MSYKRIGVLGAMASEIAALVGAMRVREHYQSAGFDAWSGELLGRECVIGRCGMGKVAAASSVQRLIDRWQVDCVLVCGLAGGLAEAVRLGDVVVGETHLQHDLDASPIFPRYHVPGLDIERFPATGELVDAACAAVEAFLATGLREALAPAVLAANHVESPRLRRGLIVTGDQFIKDHDRLRAELPEALCVEMEGGAIAQVCLLNDTPFVIVRIVSDNADAGAPVDFLRFVQEVAPAYVLGIVRELLPRLD